MRETGTQGLAPSQGALAPERTPEWRAEAPPLRVLRPGRLAYAEGLALQERLVAEHRIGDVPDTLVLLEHDAVVTLRRAADPGHVLLDRQRLARRGVELFETGRGGDVTLHSPGQVVGYPILALAGARRDAHLYLRDLEEVMIRVARDFGVQSERVPGMTGTWAGREKLGAIGVRIHSGWITSHGFAFNVTTDLSLFDLIVPCGIRGRGVTSLSRVLGRPLDVEEVMDRFEERFVDVFTAEASTAASGGVGATAANPADVAGMRRRGTEPRCVGPSGTTLGLFAIVDIRSGRGDGP